MWFPRRKRRPKNSRWKCPNRSGNLSGSWWVVPFDVSYFVQHVRLSLFTFKITVSGRHDVDYGDHVVLERGGPPLLPYCGPRSRRMRDSPVKFFRAPVQPSLGQRSTWQSRLGRVYIYFWVALLLFWIRLFWVGVYFSFETCSNTKRIMRLKLFSSVLTYLFLIM